MRRGRLLFLGSQVDGNVQPDPDRTTHLLGLDGIPIELCFVSQHAHSGIDVARISPADTALQLQIHFFAASRIFLAEDFGIDRRLLVHHLVVSLENRTFAYDVVSREFNDFGKGRQGLLVALAHAADVNRDRCHTQTGPFAAQDFIRDPTCADAARLQDHRRTRVALIEQQRRKPIYTDFEDLMGTEIDVELPGVAIGTDSVKFRAKARAFLREHLDHVAIHKLRMNRPLTETDLRELERMLAESGLGGPEDIRRAAEESQGLGLFVRSLVGLDRSAAKDALGGFMARKELSANQIESINLLVDHLTEHGVAEPRALYESPFCHAGRRFCLLRCRSMNSCERWRPCGRQR